MSPDLDAFLAGLVPFLERLRSSGYRVPTDQMLSARWLVGAMADRGQIPEDLNRLETWIAPIVCASPREQDEFSRHFRSWVASLGPGPQAPGPAATTAELRREVEKPLLKYAILGVALIAAVILAVALVVPRALRPASQVTTTTSGPGVVIPPPVKEAVRSIPSLIATGGACLFVLTGGLWILLRLLGQRREREIRAAGERRAAVAGRAGADPEGSPTLEFRIRASEPWSHAGRRRIDRAAVDLLQRRPAEADAGAIDVAATLKRFIRRDGAPGPVPATRRVTPDYLTLIDRAGLRDHQADWSEALVDRLAAAQVSVARYEFAGDPRACHPRRGPAQNRAVILQDLAERFPEHRLLLFTAGEGLIDPRTGRLAAWAGRFAAWPTRAVLTPVPRASWSRLERDLAGAGWLVAPATPDGIAEVARRVVDREGIAPADPDLAPADPVPPLPGPLRDEPDRWLDPTPPDPGAIERLIRDLRWYMKEDYPWLAACAVYPELVWDLTRELGRVARGDLGPTDALEAGLARLGRLPWFREGVMPDWLRVCLLADLPTQLKAEVRDAINQLIMDADHVEPSEFPSRSTLAFAGPAAANVGVIGEVARGERERRRLDDPAGPWGDPLLGTFLEGREPDTLDFRLPRNVRDLIDRTPAAAVPPAEPEYADRSRSGRFVAAILYPALGLYGLILAGWLIVLVIALIRNFFVGLILIPPTALFVSRARLPLKIKRGPAPTWKGLILPVLWDLWLMGVTILGVVVGSGALVNKTGLIGEDVLAKGYPSFIVAGVIWLIVSARKLWKLRGDAIGLAPTMHRGGLLLSGAAAAVGLVTIGFLLLIGKFDL